MRKPTAAIVAGLCGLMFAGHALGEDDHILARLNHSDYKVRVEATRELLAQDKLGDADIERLFARASTPEQRHRLLVVARHHMLRHARENQFVRGSRGSLGVSIQHVEAHQLPGYDHGAVYIDRTFPGFPAYWRLQRGDMVVAINGEKPTGLQGNEITMFLQTRIMRLGPGSPVQLTILRDGGVMDVTVNLASFEALSKMYSAGSGVSPRLALPLSVDLLEAWHERRAFLLDLAPPT